MTLSRPFRPLFFAVLCLATAAGIAQVLFFIFLIVFVVALVMGLVARRSGPPV